MSKQNNISKSKLAKSIKRDPSFVTKLLRKGIIKEERDGKINYKKAIKAIANASDPARDEFRKGSLTRGRKPVKIDGSTYHEARTVREHYNARLLKLNYEREIGTLIRKADVEKEAFRVGRTIRDVLLNLPDRLSGIFASEKKQEKIHEVMTKEIHQALEGLKGI